jgi:hypothetical protein
MRMNTVTIDTHKYVQKLIAEGFTQKQAETVIEIFQKSDLATKQDIQDLRTELKTEIKNSENRLAIKGLIFLFLHGLLLTATIAQIVD